MSKTKIIIKTNIDVILEIIGNEYELKKRMPTKDELKTLVRKYAEKHFDDVNKSSYEIIRVEAE